MSTDVGTGSPTGINKQKKKPKDEKEEDVHVTNMDNVEGEDVDIQALQREEEDEWMLEEEDADDELIEFLDPTPPAGADSTSGSADLKHSSTLNMRRRSEYLCRVAANRAVVEKKATNKPSSLVGMVGNLFSFSRHMQTGAAENASSAGRDKVQLQRREAQLARVKLCVDEMRRLQEKRRLAAAPGLSGAGPMSGTKKKTSKGRKEGGRAKGVTPGQGDGSGTVVPKLVGRPSAAGGGDGGRKVGGRMGQIEVGGATGPATTSTTTDPTPTPTTPAGDGGSATLIPKIRSSFIANLRQMVAAEKTQT